ncbi:hypothetical protein CCR75_008215 [Bremia lactucae]|uniref:Uncharacterized protein n=1 Tax=Bremia lactucae TaxID=4779 RepID=A0A976IGE1_BRELC|nr:hypothetical protein CCR75_008215 [Bremia lactucae]
MYVFVPRIAQEFSTLRHVHLKDQVLTDKCDALLASEIGPLKGLLALVCSIWSSFAPKSVNHPLFMITRSNQIEKQLNEAQILCRKSRSQRPWGMMMDEEVKHSLEQEAIALVNLSNPINSNTMQPQHVDSFATSKTEIDASLKQVELLDSTISMKSLLVTLKTRQLPRDDVSIKHEQSVGSHDVAETVDVSDSGKLPSFRTVFEPPTAPHQEETVEPVPSEIKCKYRTGKCHHMRALKSCGDYHNLCNYHRLRANANQRKLDRKKKERRLQQQQLTALPCALTQPPMYTSSQAAAAALASLVVAYPSQPLDLLPQQRPLFTAGATVQEVDKANRNRNPGVCPKQKDTCSY